jgi:RNA-dependent RNA polymerase
MLNPHSVLGHPALAGIMLLGRRYTCLAYSSSQLKEQSAWLVCTSDSQTVTPDGIRTWMGDFMDTVKIPAKCAARMGQCFSSTVQTSTLSLGEHRLIPDVERDGFVFSDGVGQISEQLLREVLSGVPFARADEEEISAIQVGEFGTPFRCEAC